MPGRLAHVSTADFPSTVPRQDAFALHVDRCTTAFRAIECPTALRQQCNAAGICHRIFSLHLHPQRLPMSLETGRHRLRVRRRCGPDQMKFLQDFPPMISLPNPFLLCGEIVSPHRAEAAFYLFHAPQPFDTSDVFLFIGRMMRSCGACTDQSCQWFLSSSTLMLAVPDVVGIGVEGFSNGLVHGLRWPAPEHPARRTRRR